MLQVDISSDIDAAIRDVGDFAWTQVPFATSQAINNTIFNVRSTIVNETYPRAFEVRNKRFASRLWQVTQKAKKNELEAMLTQTLDREYFQNHTRGGVKTGRSGGRVAVPAKPDAMRTGTGRIRKNLKPQALGQKKNFFVVQKGTKKFILRRNGRSGDVELVYAIVPSAQIKSSFNFFEDAQAVTLREFPGLWNMAMNVAIRSSRFVPA